MVALKPPQAAGMATARYRSRNAVVALKPNIEKFGIVTPMRSRNAVVALKPLSINDDHLAFYKKHERRGGIETSPPGG